MQVAGPDQRAMRSILGALSDGGPADVMRESVANSVAALLKADYMASFVWNPAKRGYGTGISLNMDPGNVRRYEQHFQFNDPVTPVMAKRQAATIVDSVISRSDLERSEFYCDFLAVDGLHHGINFFAYRDGRHLGDLRLWRSRHQPDFDESDRLMLELIGRAMAAQLSVPDGDHPALPAHIAELLTAREFEVAEALAEGLSDSEIALRLHISHATVRTHLTHLFEKLQVRSRLAAIAAMRPGGHPQF
jgi:DNA-binding CsgD family transcriptional regulator